MSLTLTPEEIAMIEIKRKREELEKQEQLLKHKQRLDKDIEYQKSLMKKDIADGEAQVKVTQDLFSKGFDTSLFEINISSYSKYYDVWQYMNLDNPKECGFEKETVWKDTATIRNAEIRVIGNKNISVRVIKDRTAWKMELSGVRGVSSLRGYTNPKTVIDKIKEQLRVSNKEALLNDLKKKAEETCIEFWSTKYPTATITKQSLYTGGYWGEGRYRSWSDRKNEHVGVCIVLTNGVTVYVRYEESQDKWFTQQVKYPVPPVPKGEAEDVVNQLSQMQFNIQ